MMACFSPGITTHRLAMLPSLSNSVSVSSHRSMRAIPKVQVEQARQQACAESRYLSTSSRFVPVEYLIWQGGQFETACKPIELAYFSTIAHGSIPSLVGLIKWRPRRVGPLTGRGHGGSLAHECPLVAWAMPPSRLRSLFNGQSYS